MVELAIRRSDADDLVELVIIVAVAENSALAMTADAWAKSSEEYEAVGCGKVAGSVSVNVSVKGSLVRELKESVGKAPGSVIVPPPVPSHVSPLGQQPLGTQSSPGGHPAPSLQQLYPDGMQSPLGQVEPVQIS